MSGNEEERLIFMCSSFNDKNVELIQFSMPLNPKRNCDTTREREWCHENMILPEWKFFRKFIYFISHLDVLRNLHNSHWKERQRLFNFQLFLNTGQKKKTKQQKETSKETKYEEKGYSRENL